jgi:hypothetical protein
VLRVDIDLASVAKIRAEFPVLGDRRLGMGEPAGKTRRSGRNSSQSM